MKPRHKKMAVIVVSVVGFTVAALFVLNAFWSNLVFFYSPSQVLAGEAPRAQRFRVGGLVEQGSVKKSGMKVDFIVTDTNEKISVHYEGILPDLFREGQGVIAQGRLMANNRFVADEILAKHDENYMPPEVADALAKQAKDQ